MLPDETRKTNTISTFKTKIQIKTRLFCSKTISNLFSLGKRAIRFARKLSRHLKKVEIHIYLPFDSSDESVNELKTFSELFDASVLKKIDIRFYDTSIFDKYQNLKEDLFKVFTRLIQNQNSLQVKSYFKLLS